MTRGVGVVEALSTLPEWVVFLAGVVTQLGDVWFLALAIAGLSLLSRSGREYVDEPLRDGLFLFGLLIGAYALTIVLKQAFGLPRPPGAGTAPPPGWFPGWAAPVYVELVVGTGYGFPSGHAVTTSLVYGGAASVLTVWTRRRRVVAAAAVVAVVCTTRIVLGVHYLVDVVAGVGVALVALLAVARLAHRDPTRILGGAVGLSVLAFALAPIVETGLGLAASAAALGVWQVASRTD